MARNELLLMDSVPWDPESRSWKIENLDRNVCFTQRNSSSDMQAIQMVVPGIAQLVEQRCWSVALTVGYVGQRGKRCARTTWWQPVHTPNSHSHIDVDPCYFLAFSAIGEDLAVRIRHRWLRS